LIDRANGGLGGGPPYRVAPLGARDLGSALQIAIRAQVKLDVDVLQVPEPFDIAALVPDAIEPSAHCVFGVDGGRLGRALILAGRIRLFGAQRPLGPRTPVGVGLGRLLVEAGGQRAQKAVVLGRL